MEGNLKIFREGGIGALDLCAMKHAMQRLSFSWEI